MTAQQAAPPSDPPVVEVLAGLAVVHRSSPRTRMTTRELLRGVMRRLVARDRASGAHVLDSAATSEFVQAVLNDTGPSTDAWDTMFVPVLRRRASGGRAGAAPRAIR